MKFKEQIYKQLSTRVRCPASASKENSTKWTFIQRLFSWKTCSMHKNQCMDAWNWRKLPWSPWRRLWACLRNYRPLDSWTRTTTSWRCPFFREVANCLFLILLLYHNQYTYYDSTKKRALCGRLSTVMPFHTQKSVNRWPYLLRSSPSGPYAISRTTAKID